MKFSMIQNAQYTKPSPLKDGTCFSLCSVVEQIADLACYDRGRAV